MSLAQLDAITEDKVAHRPAKTAAPRPLRGIIHHGDCLATMKTMPAEAVRAVVTSPPYNIKNSTGNGLKNGRKGKWPKAACSLATMAMTTACPTSATSHGSETASRR